MTFKFARLSTVLVAMMLMASACVGIESGDDAGPDIDGDLFEIDEGDGAVTGDIPGDCIGVPMAVSSEKIELLTQLANSFNDSDGADLDGRCVFVKPERKASGGAMQALAAGWNEAVDGTPPVIWSPAAATWGPVLNQRLADQGKPEMVSEGRPFMLTPLVIAMPKPMAEALGWPNESLGWSDILELSQNPDGWAAYGHPEWGPFRLGKTNPNFSTSGLAALVSQTYAGSNKTAGLSTEDVLSSSSTEFARSIESSVVHYGDTTLTFLNNWALADSRGTALLYTSAAAVEEKSVIDYNLGNPDGVVDPGEEIRPPRVPLVAIYPEEGTLYSDNPFFVVNADWVSDDQKAAAALFADYVQLTENQERVLEFGFRPGNAQVAITDPITAENGVDASQPTTLFEVPSPSVMNRLIDQWNEVRKEARVILVMDVSGSMKDFAVPGGSDTKLDLAKAAAIRALDQFKPSDEVGLWTFTTQGRGPNIQPSILELVPVGPISQTGDSIASKIDGLFPLDGTPLYESAQQSFDAAVAAFDDSRINAVVLLTDGRNDDGDIDDDRSQLDNLLTSVQDTTDGENSTPVRIFPIAYGSDADFDTLRSIAEASNARAYSAANPETIDKVFTQVISNF